LQQHFLFILSHYSCLCYSRCSAQALRREEVVDTTGAGDAYIAAFLVALLHGWQLQVQ
jgi:sugar/nucleoside kinase (ribokinase family)